MTIIAESTKKILLRLIAVIMIMEMLDATVLNTALPQIAKGFAVNPIQLKEIITIYFMALGVFIPISGWCADRFGEKKALLFAITLFTISSIACGLAINLPMLTICRFLQGVGGAFLMPIGRQIIFRTYGNLGRIQAMAKINVMAYIGLLLGPIIGGALTTYANWRWIFFMNLPIGLLGFFLVQRYLPIFRQKIMVPFDFFGFVLIGISLGSLLFLLDILIDDNIHIYFKLLLLVGSILSFLIYLRHAKYFTLPLFNLNLFRQGNFKWATLGSFFTRLTLTTQPFLIPLLLQAGYGYSAINAGLFIVPTMVSTLITVFFLKAILKNFDHHRLLILNTILLLIIFWSYYGQSVQLNPPLLIFQQIFIGFLLPIQLGLMNNNIYKDLSEPYASQGVTVNSIIIQVSGSFGIALAALVMIAVIGPNDLQHHVPLIAFKIVFIVQGLYLLAALYFFEKAK